MTIVTVVLASGRGRRLGGPKALLAWPHAGGELPLALAHASERLAAESERVIVVTRHDVAERLAPFAAELGAALQLLASTADDELGPAGSLAAAADALTQLGASAIVLVTPVDGPPARPSTVAALLAALDDDRGLLAARPRYRGRGGHPVAIRATTLAAYRVTDPPPLRDHLRALGTRVANVDVDDPQISVDLDNPDDLLGWVESARFL